MYLLAGKLRPKDFSITRFKEKYNELKMRKFTPKIPFSIDYKDYLIKTADSFAEVREVHRLRRVIFSSDYGILSSEFGIDFGRYDMLADHIILIHKPSQKVIATYRLISSTVSREFYSQTEYEIDSLVINRENKVELSRACVHPNFRGGAAIALIWRGLGEYVRRTDSRYLFGISSRPCYNPKVGALLADTIASASKSNNFSISVKKAFALPKLDSGFVCNSEELKLPPLLLAYLNAGAKIHGEPAFDRDFNSVDFFTLLDTREMDQKYFDRYFRGN